MGGKMMTSDKAFMGMIIILMFHQFNSYCQINSLDTVISINPRQTYLRINNDSGTQDAIPLNISSLGISWGDYLIFQQLGDYDNGPGGDQYTGMIGVFSVNDSLLDPSQQHRVPGAIDAGDDFVSSPTWSGNLTTDIPEDFRIDSTIIQVPDSALYIFVSTHDSKYGDNSDPDNDFAVNIQITTAPTKVTEKDHDHIAENYHLYQNYPNPFNPNTTIEFDLANSSKVTLKIFNILGEEVATLLSERLTAGFYSNDWDAGNLASGVYLYRLKAGEYVETKKMILMR
jgi:hypothetical protein